MKPGRHDEVVPRQQPWTLTFTYKVNGQLVDVSDLKVQLVVRANRYDEAVLLTVDNLADGESTVDVGGDQGVVSVTVPEAQVAELGSARVLWYTVRVGPDEAGLQALFAGNLSLEDW